MSAGYRLWTGSAWTDVDLPVSGGDAVVVPNIAAFVRPDDGTGRLLLQRRDKPGEPVRGRLEVPGGRWRAGEGVTEALRREVEEETGLVVTRVATPVHRWEPVAGWPVVAAASAIVAVGVDGTFPALQIGFACTAAGTPRPLAGETLDPRWWDVDDVRALVRDEPAAFTAGAWALLAVYLEVEPDRSG